MFLNWLFEEPISKPTAELFHALVIVVAVLHLLVEILRIRFGALGNKNYVWHLSGYSLHSFDNFSMADLKKYKRHTCIPHVVADAFDKVISKSVFAVAGVDLPRHVCVGDGDKLEAIAGELAEIGSKFVVKPVKQGSSVGVVIVDECAAAAQAGLKCFAEFGDCMIEEFIDGREITVGILNGVALPITEIVSKAKFYDYEAKYLDDATEYLFDTITDPALIKRINQSALACYNSLGCRHQSRVDMILTEDGVPYVLEINTLPGFTGHSLLPMAAKRAGMSGSELCCRIIGCE